MLHVSYHSFDFCFFATVLKTSLKALKRIVLMVAQVLLNKLKTTELCALKG